MHHKRSKLKITAELFEKFFGLEAGSLVDIKFDQDNRVLYIYNTDSRIGFDLAEGQHVPATQPLNIDKKLEAIKSMAD